MKMPLCAVHTCKNFGIHIFPQNAELRSQWIKALRIDVVTGRQLIKKSTICSEHFKPSDFIITPPLLVGDSKTKRLKNRSVPSIFPWTAVAQNITPQEDENFKLPSKTYAKSQPAISFVEEIPFVSLEQSAEDDPLKLDTEECEIEESYTVDTSTSYNENENVVIDIDDSQTELGEVIVQTCNNDQSIEPLLGLQSDNHTEGVEVAVQTCDDTTEAPLFSSQLYKNSKKVIHFYTGLENYEKVNLVFYSLGENVRNLKYYYGPPPQKINLFEQFFMSLIILRRHKTFEEMSMMYVISIKQVSNIFITWVRFMSVQWRKLDLWIDKSTVKAYMPLDFHDKYPNTRIIIDATECPIKKPGLPMAQQITFSTYKNRNTVKALIGIAPSGLITYVSPCYGGSASDRQIVERSEILQQFNYNDEIIVDKGLNVQDIFISYGVKVNMPAFFKKGNQIGPETLRETRKVASKRVHIERVIGQMKTYKILSEPLNRTETLLSSDIVFICAMLINFRSNVINKNA